MSRTKEGQISLEKTLNESGKKTKRLTAEQKQQIQKALKLELEKLQQAQSSTPHA